MSSAQFQPLPGESVRHWERRLRAEGLSRTAAKNAISAFKAAQLQREKAPPRPSLWRRLLGGRSE